MNNKLDAFNKDKAKCLKCKDYFELRDSRLKYMCRNCHEKWAKYIKSFKHLKDMNSFENWCNNEQT
jgi:hypothetical protein